MYLAMRLESEAENEFEQMPIYNDAEIESLEAQMTAYISKRDRMVSDSTWKQHKKISTSLMILLDNLNKVKSEYDELREKRSVASIVMVNYEEQEQTQKEYYRCQERIYNLLVVITDFRRELGKIL